MSVYSFENKKSVPLRVLSFHFAYGKMKTAIALKELWLHSYLSSKPRTRPPTKDDELKSLRYSC